MILQSFWSSIGQILSMAKNVHLGQKTQPGGKFINRFSYRNDTKAIKNLRFSEITKQRIINGSEFLCTVGSTEDVREV